MGSVECNAFLLDAARPLLRRICDSFEEATFGASQERRGRWNALRERAGRRQGLARRRADLTDPMVMLGW